MRVIIAGSRNIDDPEALEEAIEQCGFKITTVLCGCAKGIDLLGAAWAIANQIPVEYYPANWKLHKKAAGPIRNAEMASKAEALVAVWDGVSRGTQHMIDLARKQGLAVYVKLLATDDTFEGFLDE